MANINLVRKEIQEYTPSDIASAIGQKPNVRGSEGVGVTTMASSDIKWQIFNLTGARTIVLPSSGVTTGDVYRLDNHSSNTLTVQSSNGSTIGTSTSSFMVLVALQDAPSTAAGWRFSDQPSNESQSNFSSTWSTNTFTSATIVAKQNIVTASISYRYNNTNGTALTPRHQIRIMDGATVLASRVYQFAVPSGFADIVCHTFVATVRKPATVYTIDFQDVQIDGGSHSLTNASTSVNITACLGT